MWAAIGVWAAGVGLVGAAVGLLLPRVPEGKVTWVNRLAAPVLGWGLSVAHGRLVPGVLVSWARWTVIGGSLICLWFRPPGTWGGRPAVSFGPVGKTLLVLAWIVDAGALLYCLKVSAVAFRSMRQLGPVMAVLVGLIVVSAALAALGHPWFALVVAGGPPLFVGGGYGLLLAVMMIGGRHTRWN